MIYNILRFLNTVKYLKLSQIFYRLWYRFYHLKNLSLTEFKVRRLSNLSVPFLKNSREIYDDNTWNLLNVEGALEKISWRGGSRSLLWRYHQHYFDCLMDVKAQVDKKQYLELISIWEEQNPVGTHPGWDPYPTSLRLVNLVKYHLSVGPLPARTLKSMALQANYLEQRLEYHLLGNHLIANAKALIFTGVLFGGLNGRRFLSKGIRILKDEISEQILEDGGHFELSPMYHAIILEDFLDVYNVLTTLESADRKDYVVDIAVTIENVIPAMFTWLNSMCHPDEEISFFNDATQAQSASKRELLDYARSLKFRERELCQTMSDMNSSGYVRLQNQHAVVIADICDVKANYIPGHTHADTLSFELSLGENRVFVNSGISEYGSTELRMLQRSTKAHNTLQIGGQDSSETWSGFRLGRRAKITGRNVNTLNSKLFATGEHDGYMRGKLRTAHSRSWELSETSLRVIDSITKLEKETPVTGRLYLHPNTRVIDVTSDTIFLELNNRQRICANFSGIKNLSIQPSVWAKEFGQVIDNKCIVYTLSSKIAAFTITWSD